MNFRKQKHGQVDFKIDPHKLPKINGKRKSGGQIRSAYEGEFLKTEAAPEKRRSIQSFGHQGPATKTSFRVLEKVDTFPFSRKYVGEECVCLSSSEHRVNQSVEETENNQCSVASCSTIYASNFKLPSGKKYSNRAVVNFDDAQSSCYCPNGRKTEPLTEKKVAAKIHNLGLCAYRKTMRAFYASGCLTWDQEALLTDLRLSLHISHDEHLSELTRLRPAQAV